MADAHNDLKHQGGNRLLVTLTFSIERHGLSCDVGKI